MQRWKGSQQQNFWIQLSLSSQLEKNQRDCLWQRLWLTQLWVYFSVNLVFHCCSSCSLCERGNGFTTTELVQLCWTWTWNWIGIVFPIKTFNLIQFNRLNCFFSLLVLTFEFIVFDCETRTPALTLLTGRSPLHLVAVPLWTVKKRTPGCRLNRLCDAKEFRSIQGSSPSKDTQAIAGPE